MDGPARRPWNAGLRTRLLLAFLAITGFAVIAAAAGIYAFREVGGRLDVVDTRVPPALSALELSRSAERIIAAAPALLAAGNRNQRDEIKAELAAEVERLNAGVLELKSGRAELPPLQIEPIVASLTANLTSLNDLVARRLDTAERLRALQHRVFRINDATQRLLAPWLQVLGGQIAALVEASDAGRFGAGEDQQLSSLIGMQQQIRTAQAEISSVADMLAEASTTDRPERLAILAFQLGLAFRDLETTAAQLDPKLRPFFLEHVGTLRQLSEGPDSIVAGRQQELAFIADGERLLAETNSLSAELTAAVDQLGVTAKRDIDAAIRDALSVQRLSTRVLIAVVAISLLSSVLIAWLYVGRQIVHRLGALSDAMRAIAAGSLWTPVPVEGADEIAAMGRAVEVFRRNTLERDGLLAEKAQAADRLEEEVRERTAELAKSVAEVEEKSRQLEFANQYKARFLASASHDLRQPLHALNLFVAQLPAESAPEERNRLVANINAAVGSMNELLEALLDMSKLDAGVLEPDLSEFPMQPLLARIETTFAEAAREKGLRFHVVPTSAWVRSDFILLERILLNLVSNAVRYTSRGGVVVGCRRRGRRLRIDVWDSGAGIPEEHQRHIFSEFVQLAPANADRRGGLGLGLSIVARLGHLLGHPIELRSRPGTGSRFSVAVPIAAARPEASAIPAPLAALADPIRGKLVVVIDDDPLALDGMSGLLRGWGCEVVAVPRGEAALQELSARGLKPDLVISDYRLAHGETGITAIKRLRRGLGYALPALLVSGDTTPEPLRGASAGGYQVLHKPVSPMRLRAICNQLLKARKAPDKNGAATRLHATRHPAALRDPAPRPR